VLLPQLQPTQWCVQLHGWKRNAPQRCLLRRFLLPGCL
jgi:hypothetical protein